MCQEKVVSLFPIIELNLEVPPTCISSKDQDDLSKPAN